MGGRLVSSHPTHSNKSRHSSSRERGSQVGTSLKPPLAPTGQIQLENICRGMNPALALSLQAQHICASCCSFSCRQVTNLWRFPSFTPSVLSSCQNLPLSSSHCKTSSRGWGRTGSFYHAWQAQITHISWGPTPCTGWGTRRPTQPPAQNNHGGGRVVLLRFCSFGDKPCPSTRIH